MSSTTRRLVPLLFLVAGCVGSTSLTEVFDESDVMVGSEALTVWVADGALQRQRGLMEVVALPDGIDGMLFVFPSPSSRSFNMADTPMPLDIWWFDSDGVLVGSTEMEPCVSESCVSYRSPGPVQWALETPLGEYDFDRSVVLSTIDSV